MPCRRSPTARPRPGAQPNRDLLRLASHPALVSFAASVAALELAPVEALGKALEGALRDEGAQALQVGATQGYPPLRAAIAELLRQRGLEVDPNTVCITSGCQQGIDLAAKVFVGAGDSVLVEQPSFLGALEAFRARGARVIGVPIEADGLRVEALPSLIQRHRPEAAVLHADVSESDRPQSERRKTPRAAAHRRGVRPADRRRRFGRLHPSAARRRAAVAESRGPRRATSSISARFRS